MPSLGKKLLLVFAGLTALLFLVLILNSNTVFASETASSSDSDVGGSLIESAKQLAKLASLAKAIVDMNFSKLLLKAIVEIIKAWGSALDKYVLIINPFIDNKILDTQKFVLVPLGIYTSIAMIVMSVLHAMFTTRDTSIELKQSIYRYLTYLLVVPLFVVFVIVATKVTDRIVWLMADTIVGEQYTYVYKLTNRSDTMVLDSKTLLLSFISTSVESKAHPLIGLISTLIFFVGSLLLIFYGIFRRFVLTALVIASPIILALPIFPNIKTFDPVSIVLKLCFQQIGIMLGLLIALLFVIHSDGSELLSTVVPLLAFILTFTLAKNAGDIVKNAKEGLSYTKGVPYIGAGYKQIENYRNRGVQALPSPPDYPLLEARKSTSLGQANSQEFYNPQSTTKVKNETAVITNSTPDSRMQPATKNQQNNSSSASYSKDENTKPTSPKDSVQSKETKASKKDKKLNTERKA